MRRRDAERLRTVLRAKARAKGLHLASNRVHDERDPDYGRVALSRGRYGPLLHPPGPFDKYAISMQRAEELIEAYAV